ncbi:MAG TPA: zinc ribbon domain-containing protein [Candidatus Limnocylindria bacterium]
MTGESVDCFNCGRANPSWAQICRSCGVPMRPGGAGSAPPSGRIPTDRDSLLSIGAALATIGAAIIFGIVLSGMLPEAPAVAASASPTPSQSIAPSGSEVPASASAEPSPRPTPELIGRVTFGRGLNRSTQEVIDQADTFASGGTFCHSISLPEPFGVDQYQEEVLKIRGSGDLTVVQRRVEGTLPVDSGSSIVGWCNPTDVLIFGFGGSDGWGTGRFLLRAYRQGDGLELLAQGRFRLTD